MGREDGLTDEHLSAISEYDESDAFSTRQRLALRLADAIVATPATVPDDLFAELVAEYTEAELVELASAIAWENYRARFNRVFAIESEGFSEGAFCPLPIP